MSLYLKYRPGDFENLVGQDFIKETLQNVVENKIAVGAYIFCGPRGTGKTSSARIFAKALNCTNPKNGNPCGECEICREFQNESLIDIIEIDAASHTGVDNIREIIEKAEFKPSKTQYKIYIVDEVHMLSKGAFNALLKILEEPPKHVKFILATTETHKVPETILSRCQRYDFKSIEPKAMDNRLQHIAKTENIEHDQKAIEYIIKSSGGGLRNAISLFEQLVEKGKISYDKIISKLGVTPQESLDTFLQKLVEKDPSVIDDFHDIQNEGKNIKLFIKDLIYLAKDSCIKSLKENKNISQYIHILEVLDTSLSQAKQSYNENITFSIAILKLVGNNNIEQNTTKNSSPQIPEEKKQEPKQTKDLFNDITDIFGESPPEPKQNNTENISNNTEKVKEKISENKGNFDDKKLISTLKNLGAKGGLTMGLRAAKISHDNQTLKIHCPTEFSYKTMNNADNTALIKKGLENMGYSDSEVQFFIS